MYIKKHLPLVCFMALMIVSVSAYSSDKINVAVANSLNSWFKATGLSKPSIGWELNVQAVNESKIPERYKDKCSQPHSLCPVYDVSISFKHPERIAHDALDAWNILNNRAMEVEGATLDERIIFKLSHLLGVRADKIYVKYHTSCLSFEIMFIENEVKKTGGWACAMAGASTIVTKDLNSEVYQSLAKLPQGSLGISEIKGAEILSFINKYYSSKNSKIRIVSEDDHYVSATITGLKSEVIPSEKYWESVQVSFLISDRGDSIYLRSIVDGQYAAGLREPSTLAYNDMEPSYTKDLQQYAGFILESVKKYIIKSRTKK